MEIQNCFFSSHGNLKQTIIELVRQSSTGLSAVDISSIIEIPSNSSYFSQIKNSDGIKRKKYKGRFIYFSDAADKFQWQKMARDHQKEESWPTDAQAIDILVHLIKNPDIAPEQLAIEAAPAGKCFDHVIIKQFLKSHDLLKKTLDIGQ